MSVSERSGPSLGGSPRRPTMPADVLMRSWRPGSYPPPWSWRDELRDLTNRGEVDDLQVDIEANGIREPVLLGSDGRVWDGHHRILVAYRLDIEVPHELAVEE